MKNGKQCLFCRGRVELRRRLRLISTVRVTYRRNAYFKQLTTGVFRACHCAQGTLKRAAGAQSWAWFDLPSQMELWMCLSRASSFPATPSSSPCPNSLPLSSRLENPGFCLLYFHANTFSPEAQDCSAQGSLSANMYSSGWAVWAF